MGAWGPNIFDDDTALDVQAEFHDLIQGGFSARRATRRLIRSYGLGLLGMSDDKDETVFWLGLAATQIECGRLAPTVKRRALRVINQGWDLKLWEDSENRDERAAVLEELKAKLLGPQIVQTQLEPTWTDSTDWKIGHAIAYRLLSGRWIGMRVVHVDEEPTVELVDWIGDDPPSAQQVEKARPKRGPEHLLQGRDRQRADEFWAAVEASNDDAVAFRERLNGFGTKLEKHLRRQVRLSAHFCIYSERREDDPGERIRVVGTAIAVDPRGAWRGAVFGGWRELDKRLRYDFGIQEAYDGPDE